ncbi:hypothetical protein ACFVU2_21115 [Leifsonia sp. NPDC058194]|uniref:VG15 protein n=1 Tax=Leifsonia sp. NPDC058194 TaxID=3346374 RepID=UPI0036DEFFF8
MPTMQDIEAYRDTLTALSTRAVDDVGLLLAAVGTDGDPVKIRDLLIDAFPAVIQPYVTASGELSAAWYEDLRHAAVGGEFYATTVANLNADQMAASVRWAVGPLFGQSNSTVLALLSGTTQRAVADAGRNTIDTNARKDVVSTSWSRVARPGACEFCTMLAGRGPVYRSEDAAGVAIGRGVDPSRAFDESGSRKVGGIGQGVKARGKQALAHEYHDDCHCVTKPTFYTRETYTYSVRGYPRTESVLVPIPD